MIPLFDIFYLQLASATSDAMAGLGRRTHYRKHLTDSVLYDLPEPKEYERIAKVVGTRGGNQFEIILAGTTLSKTEDRNRSGLALLPTKFHKLVWVKRNDYVIVQTGMDKEPGNDQNEDDNNTKKGGHNEDQEEKILEASTSNDPTETGIRFIISHILYKDQVKHLVSKGFWPKNDPEFSESGNNDTETTADVNNNKKSDDDGIVYTAGDDDGIVYDEYDMENDDDLFVNTNRIARLEIQDSDEEEQSSVEEN